MEIFLGHQPFTFLHELLELIPLSLNTNNYLHSNVNKYESLQRLGKDSIFTLKTVIIPKVPKRPEYKWKKNGPEHI